MLSVLQNIDKISALSTFRFKFQFGNLIEDGSAGGNKTFIRKENKGERNPTPPSKKKDTAPAWFQNARKLLYFKEEYLE